MKIDFKFKTIVSICILKDHILIDAKNLKSQRSRYVLQNGRSEIPNNGRIDRRFLSSLFGYYVRRRL